MHGKMGISICFFHLARQTGNQIYEDYAGELIDEIYEEITANTPVGFENGLAGIGWGIEYLVQNGFIEADTDEVLEEFDNRIFKELIYNTPHDIGLLNGLVGIGAYFLKRIQNPASNDEKIPTLTNKQTLIHIIDELDRKTQNIPEIISEPLSERSPSVKPSNLETYEPPNEKRQTTNHEPQTTNKQFDLTWDCPALLWFLAELYEQNIFNFKVEKIIQRLTEPLSKESNMPKLHSNRLLLALALTKLQKNNSGQPTANNERQTTVEPSKLQISVKSSSSRTLEQSSNSLRKESYGQTIIEQLSNLLTKINRNTINSELPPHNTTLRYGTSGIAWIYQQLHRQTGDNHFKEEMEYWHQLPFKSEKSNEIFSGINNESLNAWGMLEGLAGMLLNNETINLKKQKKR
jgi:Fe-S cluster biosynthesis and repair protein YggX